MLIARPGPDGPSLTMCIAGIKQTFAIINDAIQLDNITLYRACDSVTSVVIIAGDVSQDLKYVVVRFSVRSQAAGNLGRPTSYDLYGSSCSVFRLGRGEVVVDSSLSALLLLVDRPLRRMCGSYALYSLNAGLIPLFGQLEINLACIGDTPGCIQYFQ